MKKFEISGRIEKESLIQLINSISFEINSDMDKEKGNIVKIINAIKTSIKSKINEIVKKYLRSLDKEFRKSQDEIFKKLKIKIRSETYKDKTFYQANLSKVRRNRISIISWEIFEEKQQMWVYLHPEEGDDYLIFDNEGILSIVGTPFLPKVKKHEFLDKASKQIENEVKELFSDRSNSYDFKVFFERLNRHFISREFLKEYFAKKEKMDNLKEILSNFLKVIDELTTPNLRKMSKKDITSLFERNNLRLSFS